MSRLTEEASVYFGRFPKESDHSRSYSLDSSIITEKLGAYEDLEEQHRVLILPCCVGSTVYVIPSKVNFDLNILGGHSELNRIYEQKVEVVHIYPNNTYVLTTCDGTRSCLSEFFGITWFLKREEAEQALRKLATKE